ncbi:patatin-like phospholipase domain-containing protein 4 isoform X2 [Ptychodera flava]|uniref:patatin-like phospholipase domain-containing protein 4 isoform X2 n=1 Tax=Ptychodera flava TaxID=63121 RepID=UPI003969E5D9
MEAPSSFNVVFSGTSFLGIYSIGSAQALLDHAKNVLKKVQCYGGTSAGSIAAAFMLTAPEKMLVLMDDIFKLTHDIQSLPRGALTPNFDLMASLRQMLEQQLPPDAHKICDNRLLLLMAELLPTTKPPDYRAPSLEEMLNPSSMSRKQQIFSVGEKYWRLGSPYVMSSYNTREALIECWVDGTLVTNTPVEEFKFPPGRLITIAPNKQATHQRPQDNITPFWRDISKENFDSQPYNMFRVGDALYPPKRAQLEKYYMDGLEDAKDFLMRYRFYEHNQDTYRVGGPMY